MAEDQAMIAQWEVILNSPVTEVRPPPIQKTFLNNLTNPNVIIIPAPTSSQQSQALGYDLPSSQIAMGAYNLRPVTPIGRAPHGTPQSSVVQLSIDTILKVGHYVGHYVCHYVSHLLKDGVDIQ